MNGSRIVVCIGVALVVSMGCKKKEESPSKNADAKRDDRRVSPGEEPSAVDPLEAAHDPMKAGKTKRLNKAEYETLMLALKGCKLDGIRISNGCPAARKMATARRTSDLAPEVYDLAAKHIAHASVPVRLHAASLLRSILGSNESHTGTAVRAIPTEKHPAVLAQLIRALTRIKSKNDEVAALVIGLAKHPDPLVRAEVATALLAPLAVGVEGALPAAISMVESDEDDKVRTQTCIEIGKLVDDRALPTIERFTTDAAADENAKLYVACWRGLMLMVTGEASPAAPSEKAFDVFVSRLTSVQCSKVRPPWELMNSAATLTSPRLATEAPWIAPKLGAIHKGLARVARCAEGNWVARAGAIDALSKTGAGDKMLSALANSVREKTDPNAKKLKAKIKSVLAAASRSRPATGATD